MRGPSISKLGCLLTLACGAIATSPAAAGPPTDFDAPESTSAIYGGQPTGTCGWPSTVSVGGKCSGTLVHPEIVIYAGHCGDTPWVWFGETLDDTASGRYVETEYCVVNPNFKDIGTNTDFAFCKLATPVTDVDIVPILMGCETSLLQPGVEVTAVGFGRDEFDNYGTKRAVSFPIIAVDGEVQAGGDGLSICNGDSGGPLYLRLPPELDPEQSWRVFGVTSWGPQDCALAQFFGTMHSAVTWIEKRSGIDITPCHNADGSWQAGPDCIGFPLNPGAGVGVWADWCEAQALSLPAASCGAPTVDNDLEPPIAVIIDPLDQAVFTSDPETESAQVVIDAEVSDKGWGLASVELKVDGTAISNGRRSTPPWTWSGSFPSGGYVLEVVATDLFGNSTESAPIHIGVDQDPPEPEPEPPAETGDESGDGTSGDDPNIAGDQGCACTSASPGSSSALGFGGLALFVLGSVALKRRRE